MIVLSENVKLRWLEEVYPERVSTAKHLLLEEVWIIDAITLLIYLNVYT